jgi:hypothetical protein
MKKNNFPVTPSLGIENTLTSLKFIQDGMLDRFETLLKALSNSYSGVIILEGCAYNKTGDDYTIGVGKVYYNGEMLTVDAFEGTHATNVPVFSAVVYDYTGQNKPIYSDRVFRDTHGQRKLTIVMGASGSAISDVVNARKGFSYQKTVAGTYPNDAIVFIYTPTGCVGGIASNVGTGDLGVTFTVSGDKITASGMLTIDVPNSTADDFFESGSGYPIGFIRLELQDEFKGKAGDNSDATVGFAIATNYAASGVGNRSFANSVQCPCKIDQNGDILVKAMPRPGANKRVVVNFYIDYLKA